MRIFYYHPEKDNNMSRWQRLHFIDELARHNVRIDTFNPLLCTSWDEANEVALRKLKEGNYDVFLSWVNRKDVLYIDTLQEIRRIGIPSLFLRFDNLVIPLYDKELAPYYDLIWLTSKETKHFYDRWGVKSCFAPYAANPYVFHYDEKNIIHRACFIGTPYGSRSKMINTIAKAGVEFTLYYGDNSEKSFNKRRTHFQTNLEIPTTTKLESVLTRLKFREGRKLLFGLLVNRIEGNHTIYDGSNILREPSVELEELSGLYSQYALSLASTSAHHTDVLKHPLKIINLRNFEIPMSGGVEICRFNLELADYYEEDKEIIFYRDNEELVDKAIYYTKKAKDKELLSIKRAARKRSEGEHTWYHRFKNVLNELNKPI